MKKLILLSMLLLFAGCVQENKPEPETLPEDFHLVYSSGAMHAEWGSYNFKINRSGHSEFMKTAGHTTQTETLTLTEEEMLEIYTVIIQNNFFELNEEYRDPTVMDGGFSEISVSAEGKEHTVTVINTRQHEFETIESKIIKFLNKKLPDWHELPT